MDFLKDGNSLDWMERVAAVRVLMLKEGMDAFLVPTDDPHMSEYTASYFKRREFLCSFTGSAGVVVITQSQALLFTDSRYHTQAELELPREWTLMKMGLKDVPSPVEFLSASLKGGQCLGVDPEVHAANPYQTMEAALEKKGIAVKFFPANPVDLVWGRGRSARPSSAVRLHPLKFAGKTPTQKMSEIRDALSKEGAFGLVVSALDECCWLFNLRAADVQCCPVAVCYAVVTLEGAMLFIDDNKLPDPVRQHLSTEHIQVRPYEQAIETYQQLSDQGVIWVDGNTANQKIFSAISKDHRLNKTSPIHLMKAIKNPQEMEGMRNCHLRDGAAVVEFLCALEEQLSAGVKVTEVEVDLLVTQCRANQDLFLERSFSTICGVNEHGAIMHYRAEEDSCSTLTGNELVLLDSGAQYEDGTTDVTRTFHTGTPTDFQREMFTRVLKGNIAVDKQTFPENTPGCLLDSFARQFLWEVGKNYLHGTGHGVGAALNVHEGPHSISFRNNFNPLHAGMVTSNEPGFYIEGQFGIRIENLLEIVERTQFGLFGGRAFLGFEKLTHIPLQKKLIDVSLLTSVEIEWINKYHKDIFEKVTPYLKSEKARNWLKDCTSPL